MERRNSKRHIPPGKEGCTAAEGIPDSRENPLPRVWRLLHEDSVLRHAQMDGRAPSRLRPPPRLSQPVVMAPIAERGAIGAGSLQPYLSAINTLLRHTGRDDARATSPAIGDRKSALYIRQLDKTSEELRRAPRPCDVITDILDNLATLPMTHPGYGTILHEGAAFAQH
eukprot:jgi/Tetstr1/426902/TSEL_017115.t1